MRELYDGGENGERPPAGGRSATGRASSALLDAHLLEAPLDLGGAEAAVAAEGADGRELAGAGPPGDRLGVHAEQLRDLRGGEQRFGGIDVVELGHGDS